MIVVATAGVFLGIVLLVLAILSFTNKTTKFFSWSTDTTLAVFLLGVVLIVLSLFIRFSSFGGGTVNFS